MDQNLNKTWNVGAREAVDVIKEVYQRDAAGESIIRPVLAYYGAGRAWLPPTSRAGRDRGLMARPGGGSASRLLQRADKACRVDQLVQAGAAVNRGGRMRPGFDVVRKAVLNCVSRAAGLWFEPDRNRSFFPSKAGHNRSTT